jgi:hypothetical protein
MNRRDNEVDFVETIPFVEPLTEKVNDKQAKNQQEMGGEKEEKKPLKAKELLDGSVLLRDTLRKQYPFILFLTVLAVLYIGNRYYAERMVRKINDIEQEVKNLRAEQITTAAELMNLSRPTEVANIVEERNLGLKQSVEPPKKLVRKKKL